MQESTRSDVSTKAEDIRRDVSRAGQELREKATIIKDDVVELASSASEMARQQMDPVLKYIRDYPIRSLLISAGVGIVLGTLMRRR